MESQIEKVYNFCYYTECECPCECCEIKKELKNDKILFENTFCNIDLLEKLLDMICLNQNNSCINNLKILPIISRKMLLSISGNDSFKYKIFEKNIPKFKLNSIKDNKSFREIQIQKNMEINYFNKSFDNIYKNCYRVIPKKILELSNKILDVEDYDIYHNKAIFNHSGNLIINFCKHEGIINIFSKF